MHSEYRYRPRPLNAPRAPPPAPACLCKKNGKSHFIHNPECTFQPPLIPPSDSDIVCTKCANPRSHKPHRFDTYACPQSEHHKADRNHGQAARRNPWHSTVRRQTGKNHSCVTPLRSSFQSFLKCQNFGTTREFPHVFSMCFVWTQRARRWGYCSRRSATNSPVTAVLGTTSHQGRSRSSPW